MIEAIVIAATQYIVLQTPDGRSFHVNPKHIVSTSEAKGKLVTDKVSCIIYTSDGRFFSVVETCESIKTRLEELR
jgi:hypothetical protein